MKRYRHIISTQLFALESCEKNVTSWLRDIEPAIWTRAGMSNVEKRTPYVTVHMAIRELTFLRYSFYSLFNSSLGGLEDVAF